MVDLEEKEAENPLGREFPGNGGRQGAFEHPGNRRRAVGVEKTQAHRPPAGNGRRTGVRGRTIVKRAWIGGKLNVEKGEQDDQCEADTDPSQKSFFHRLGYSFIALMRQVVNSTGVAC